EVMPVISHGQIVSHQEEGTRQEWAASRFPENANAGHSPKQKATRQEWAASRFGETPNDSHSLQAGRSEERRVGTGGRARWRRTRFSRDWSSDVCSSDLEVMPVISHGQIVSHQEEGTRQEWAASRFPENANAGHSPKQKATRQEWAASRFGETPNDSHSLRAG